MLKIVHPVHDLLNRADLTPLEKIALYGLMHLSTFEEWSSLGPEQVWDKMLDEYEQVKRVASYEGVPEDAPEFDIETQLKARKEAGLLQMPMASKLKQ